MESLLNSWNLKRVAVPGDGNCLFTSIAFSLIQSGDTLTTECLLALGVPVDHTQDLNYIQKLLRVKMVEEWNANHEHHQGFITTDITTLAHEYFQSDQFSGCAGDLMVLTLANNCFYFCFCFYYMYYITVFHYLNTPYLSSEPSTDVSPDMCQRMKYQLELNRCIV